MAGNVAVISGALVSEGRGERMKIEEIKIKLKRMRRIREVMVEKRGILIHSRWLRRARGPGDYVTHVNDDITDTASGGGSSAG